MSTTLESALRGPLLPLFVTTVAVAAIGTTQLPGAEDKVAAEPEPVALITATEVAPSATLEDWAATADYVVMAKVTEEERVDPPESETVDPADDLIGRRVTMHIEEVRWKAEDGVESAPPEALTINALGWLPRADGDVEVAMQDSPRFEVGRTYLVALAWKRAECGEGERIPEAWIVIGSGGAVPADGGVLGAGEFEGVEVSPGNDRLDDGGVSVTTQYAGKEPDDVVRGLEGLNPKRSHAFRHVGGTCG